MVQGPRIRVSVCIHDHGRILLVQHTKREHSYWLLPGGGLEYGETLEETARREVLEETGIGVVLGPLIIVCEAIQPGGRHNLEMVFSGTVEDAGDALRTSDTGITAVAWVPREEFSGLELHPPIARHIESCWIKNFDHEVLVLGNVWQDHPGHERK